MMTTIGRILIALAVIALSPAVWSQAKVLKGKEITESALINALTPARIGTRSIREKDGAAPPVAKPAEAHVLIEFETNSTDLTDDAKKRLNVIGEALNNDRLSKFNFVLEGHADPRGTSDWNQRLSEGRAEAVLQYLVQQRNVPETRLSAVGKGDREPLNVRNPAAPENRRVTILNSMTN